jgi:hypothetical protein
LLPTGHQYWTDGKDDGSDLRIYSVDGAGNKTEIPREVVFIDKTNKKGEVHFLGDLDSTTDTTFRVYYGATGLSNYDHGHTFGRNAVWTNFVAVYHLNEDPSGPAPQAIDSTGNGNDLTSGGTMTSNDKTTGVLGSALRFEGTDDNLYLGNPVPQIHGVATALTISAWIKADVTGNDMSVFGADAGVNDDHSTGVRYDESG